MSRESSVNKSGLLKKFLNDLNKIDCTKYTVKPRRSLKYEKPKSFALPMRPKHFNRKFIKQLDGNRSRLKLSEPKAAFHSPKSNIFEPEVNIFVENRSIWKQVSFTKMHTRMPFYPDDEMETEEIPSEINFQDVLTSTRMDEQQTLCNVRFEQAGRTLHTPKQCIPNGPDEVVRCKTIYDYATNCTITDVNFEEEYTKLMQHLNTNIMEKLDSNILQTDKRCQNLLEWINQYRKFDLLDRCTQIEPIDPFRLPRYTFSPPSLLNETPSIQINTTFINKEQSTFFDLESTTCKEEFLWVKPTAAGKKPAENQIAKPKQNHAENETFFEKRDFNQDFLNFFSMQ